MPKNTVLNSIGYKTTVDFPSVGLFGVPAKVDTGADTSAVWASSIKEKKGELSFCLLGQASAFYTGERITTKQYWLRSVKNSFGASERRYKVTLPTIVEGKPLNVRFTLADRSNNTLPILIGRRTLQNKFVVDVARANDTKPTRRILILQNRQIESVTKFFAELEEQQPKLKFQLATYEDLQFIIEKKRVDIKLLDGKAVDGFDAIYFKTIGQDDHRAIAAALAHYASTHGIYFFDPLAADYPGTSKLLQYVLLAENGLAVPKSYFAAHSHLKKQYSQIARNLGEPFIVKDVKGAKGRNNFLIKSKEDYKIALAKAKKQNVLLIAQQLIPNEGDYRVLVMGKKVRLVVFRQRQNKALYLNNVSQGGRATLLKETAIPGRVRALSLKAAEIMHLNVAGVDVVQDKQTSSWYCLEVNDSPQLASGSFTTDKQKVLGEYLTRKLEQI